jgi:hypothetical protein
MASEYLTSIPAGRYRVIDTEPPHRVWGEDLEHAQAIKLKERVCGEGKSRSAAVKPMMDAAPAAPPSAPLPQQRHTPRNVRPTPPIAREYPLRFMHEIGVRAELRIYWGETIWRDKRLVFGECPNTYGTGRMGIHNATVFIGDKLDGYDEDFGGSPADYEDDAWPTRCDHCDATVPEIEWVPCNCGKPGCVKTSERSPQRQVSRRVLYQAKAGDTAVRAELAPGDMYWATWFRCAESGHCIYGWTNCDGKHLVICCPSTDGTVHPWDVNGRASNCTLPEDTLHRCWIIEGDPETGNISVTKNGRTCGAGGGSIQTSDYHGVASGGVLRTC